MNSHVPKDMWRPVSYPTQSCNVTASPDDSVSSPKPDEQPPRLPATIQAVRDPGASNSGGRTLVICLDGTGDKFDADNSNVVDFVACLKKDDPDQVTYYQSGIGTYDGHGLKNGFSALVDKAVGSGLGIHIKGAYGFLMENYRDGDKICLLGFSRGAYTVRCLAGMLHKVGLLPAQNTAQVSFAYKFYKNDTPEGWKMSGQFKKTFCTNVNVYFVGVWDCVASVGFIPRKLPFSKSPTNTIHSFRHAMALDEHRAKFKICQWQQQNPTATSQSILNKTPKVEVKVEKEMQVGRISRIFNSCFGSQSRSEKEAKPDRRRSSTSSTSHLRKMLVDRHKDEEQTKLELQFNQDDNSVNDHVATDVLEVWFTGCHADVGGGAVPNEKRHMLSKIPLRWMIRQCFECNTGILFSTAALAETGIDVQTVWPVYKATKKPVVGPSPDTVEQYEAGALPPLRRRSTVLGVDSASRRKSDFEFKNDIFRDNGFNEDEKRRIEAEILPEHVEDYFDAIAPINDQLVQAKGWWVLEFWPVKVSVQQKNSEQWDKVVRMNMGRFRAIRETEPKMHWTVQARISDKGYKIRNTLDTNAVWQVSA